MDNKKCSQTQFFIPIFVIIIYLKVKMILCSPLDYHKQVSECEMRIIVPPSYSSSLLQLGWAKSGWTPREPVKSLPLNYHVDFN